MSLSKQIGPQPLFCHPKNSSTDSEIIFCLPQMTSIPIEPSKTTSPIQIHSIQPHSSSQMIPREHPQNSPSASTSPLQVAHYQ